MSELRAGQGMQRWHEGVSLLTSFTLQDLVRHPLVVEPHVHGILPQNNLTKGRASNMDFRLKWSKAPIPSLDNKVFVGSNSIIDLTTRATQFVFARVESAH